MTGRGAGLGASALLFGPALCWLTAAGIGLVWTAGDRQAWAAVDRHGDPVVGSDDCAACHPQAYASWRGSWHRTMTQVVAVDGPLRIVANPSTSPSGQAPSRPGQDGVLAPFAGESLDHLGFRATMDRDPDGRPRITVARLDAEGGPGEVVLAADVALTVGSHRYQQYVAFLDRGGGPGELWRLPVAWHRGEQRWIHMNGAFVEPEGEAGSLTDYQRHLSRWNDNCIFCHNTQAVPGLATGLVRGQADFASEVGEPGIACEACHGPAAAHVARHRNPLRRILARGQGDASITHPGRIGPGRESAICGRCHGQRIGRDIAAILRGGDGFVPGDDLAAVSRPIFADTVVAGVPGLDGRDGALPFAARFWPDGTPRLSAYEYQGLLLSPCWQGDPALAGTEAETAGLGCNHCHDMHGDEVDGQPRQGRSGAGACVDCHAPASLGGGDRPGGHGGHGQVAPAVDCLGCHMPAITYGLLEGMISHRISSPDPAAWLGRHDQPDACTQCHVDRSRAWAARSMAPLGLRGSAAVDVEPAGLERDDAPQVLLDLLGGDAIQRNLAAHALAAPGATGDPIARMRWLAEALEDEYPSVRWFAWRGLRELAQAEPRLRAALADFDVLAPIEARAPAIEAIHQALPAGSDPTLEGLGERRERLIGERVGLEIWIGE